MNRLAHARRAVAWPVLLVASVPGAALVVVGIAFHAQGWALEAFRAGALLLAVPAAFLLDDASSAVSSAAPRSPWWDLAGRFLVLLAWAAMVALGAWGWDALVPTPQAWLLALVPCTAALVAAAAAAMMRRAGRSTPGDVLAGVVCLVLLALLRLSPSYRGWEALPVPGLAGPGDVAAWLVAASAAVVAIVWAHVRRGSGQAV